MGVLVPKLWQQKKYLIFIILLMIADPALTSFISFWLQKLFNAAIPGANSLYIIRLVVIGFLLWMVKRFVIFTNSMCRAKMNCNIREQLKKEMFQALLLCKGESEQWFVGNGEYMAMFLNDINILEQQCLIPLMNLISGVISIFILGSAFLSLNKTLAVTILSFGILSMIIPSLFSRQLSDTNYIYAKKTSFFTQKLKEYLHGMQTIHNYAVEEEIRERFDSANRKTEDAKFEMDYLLSILNNVGSLLSWFMQFIAVGVGIMLVIRGEIALGTVIAAQNFASNLASPLQNIITNLNKIHSSKSILRRIEEVSKGFDAGSEVGGTQIAPSFYGADVTFENVSLVRGSKTILDCFTYTFEHGKKYLVIGRNGSGKSSIFKVLKQQYDRAMGNITINQKNISEMNRAELSRSISYLNEDVALFSGLIKDNITLYRQYNEESLTKAIENAQIHLDLDRNIDDDGKDISSGEQRRIEIARSLLSMSSVLIFDEVVSTLDIETAYEIEKMVLGFSDKTIIFVSHNFSGKLIDQYDEILIMDSGSLVDHGNYCELIERNPYFRNLCEIKFGVRM